MSEKPKNPPLLPRVFSKKKLRLDQIRYDGGTQMRTERNQEQIDSYKEKYLAGVQMPPPVVFFDGENYWLADGFQRCEGADGAKLKTLEFHVYDGDKRQAVLYALGTNEDHGLPRDKYAKRRAALTCMLDEEWSKTTSRWIAEVCNVNHAFVARLRDLLDEATQKAANGGESVIDWAKAYCSNPKSTTPVKWGLVDRRPAATQPSQPKESPIDIPDSFVPDPQHSPPAGSGESASGYVSTSDESDDGAELFGAESEATEREPAEPATEYRTDRRGNKQKVKPKVKQKPEEEAFDAFGTDDAPDESDGGESDAPTESAIGEPLNELTAPAFAQLQEFADLHRILTDVKTRVDALVDTGAGCFIPHGELSIQLDNCRAWIYSSRPHALCPECQGDGCHRCRQSGFIPFIQYSQEQKRQKREAASAA